MGYMCHHAIIVTSWDYESIKKAWDKAVEIFKFRVGEIQSSRINDYRTFFVGPDGSKEGWEESEAGDRRRDEFIAWLETQTQTYRDGSTNLDWAEVQYGDENGNNRVLRHCDQK